MESGRETQVREGADWLGKQWKDRMVNEGGVVQVWRESRLRKNSGDMLGLLIRYMTGVEGKSDCEEQTKTGGKTPQNPENIHTMTLK